MKKIEVTKVPPRTEKELHIIADRIAIKMKRTGVLMLIVILLFVFYSGYKDFSRLNFEKAESEKRTKVEANRRAKAKEEADKRAKIKKEEIRRTAKLNRIRQEEFKRKRIIRAAQRRIEEQRKKAIEHVNKIKADTLERIRKSKIVDANVVNWINLSTNQRMSFWMSLDNTLKTRLLHKLTGEKRKIFMFNVLDQNWTNGSSHNYRRKRGIWRHQDSMLKDFIQSTPESWVNNLKQKMIMEGYERSAQRIEDYKY